MTDQYFVFLDGYPLGTAFDTPMQALTHTAEFFDEGFESWQQATCYLYRGDERIAKQWQLDIR